MILVASVLSASAGTLAGTVVDADGAAVEGAVVTLFDARGEYGSTTTDAAGAFVVEGLPDDRYRVRATAPARGTGAETWAPGAPERCTSDVFEVPATGEAIASVAMLPGATLTGTVLLPDGAPAVGAVVTANPSGDAVSRSITAGPDGAFVLSGLPGAEVTIAVSHASVLDQYWGASFDDDLAWTLQLELANTTDLGTVALLAGAALSGTVYGPEGLGVPFGKVVVSSGGATVSAETLLDGTWSLPNVPPGSASLVAEGPNLTSTWYPDLSRPGDRLPLADEEVVTGLDFTLATASRLFGTVPGAPWPEDRYARIKLTSTDGLVRISAWLLEDGTFSINRLYGGEYTLFVDAADKGYYPDVLRNEDGTERILVIPDATDVDLGLLELSLAATITGAVTDAARGGPVDHAYVVARQSGTEVEHVVYAEDDGTYALRGLEPGSWALFAGFESPCPVGDREWVTFWYPDTPNELFGGLVDVEAGEELVWDVAIPPDDDHDQMDDAWEAANGLDPVVDDADEDPDGDGFDNLDEYRLGTDPTDSARTTEECGCAGTGGPPWAAVALVMAGSCARAAAGRSRGSASRRRRAGWPAPR